MNEKENSRWVYIRVGYRMDGRKDEIRNMHEWMTKGMDGWRAEEEMDG